MADTRGLPAAATAAFKANPEDEELKVTIPVPPRDTREYLSPATPPSLTHRITEPVAEFFSPLTGPTDEQIQRDGIYNPETHQMEYKPLGNKVDREGFFPALSHPFVPLPKFKHNADDGVVTAYAKAFANAGIGLGEFFESPLGVATAGIGDLPMIPAKAMAATKEAAEAVRISRNLGKVVAGGYAVDMASKIPSAAQHAGETSVTGTTGEAVEADLGLGMNVVLPAMLASHATELPRTIADKLGANGGGAPDVAPPASANKLGLNQGVSEFGGEAGVTFKGGENDAIIQGQQQAGGEQQYTGTDEVGTSTEAGGGDSLVGGRQVAQEQPQAGATAGTPAVGTSVLADTAKYPVVETPLKGLTLSEDVPNFKAEADTDTGVVQGQKLEGSYERLGTGAITVYERLDGSREVISGRHRFDLAKRTGEQTIPAQVVREADGFTPQMAQTLDAEMNIRDGQGTVGDYANYFRNSTVTADQAAQRGLLAREKGRAGWALGKQATDDLFALYRAGKVSEPQAVAISQSAPGDTALQRVGATAALKGSGALELKNFMQAVRLETKAMPAEQFDLFAADDSALTAARDLAKTASRIQTELAREIKATDNAAKAATTAKAKGITFDRAPEEILAENQQLRGQLAKWDNWALHPELVEQVRGYAEMKRAGEAPKIVPLPKPEPRTLEDKLEGLKINTRGQLFESTAAIPAAMWNASIDVIKLGVRAGKTLANAIEDGIAWLKQNHPNIGFDPDEYRKAVNDQYGLREFGRKLAADPTVSDEVKQQVGEYVYEKRSNETDAESAQRIIQAHGLSGATELYTNDRVNIPGAVRSILGKQIIKGLALQEAVARGKGDTATADRLADRAVDVVDHDLKRSTEVAQSLQAMGTWGELSPEGMLRHARRTIAGAGDKMLAGMRPETELLRKGFAKANGEALDEVTQDAGVNAKARSAVNEAVENSADTRKAVVMEVAEGFADSPEIVRQARAMAAQNVGKLLSKTPTPFGTQSKAALTQMIGDLAKRAADIAANHYQGAELGKTLSQKFQERLGLDKASADKLARGMDERFAAMVDAARKKIPQRIAAMRARQAAPFNPEEFSQAGVDAEIRRQLRTANLSLGELVKRHGSEVDAAGKSIDERVVRDAGLTGPRAEALQAAFDKRFNELATAKKQALLAQALKDKVHVAPKVRSALDKLITFTNLGAFDADSFYGQLRKRLDLPEVTPEFAREVVRRATALQELPEGFQRDRAGVQLLDYIGGQTKLKWWELATSMWYANVLSHATVGPHVVLDNLANLAGNTLVAMVRNPRSVGDIVPALWRGAGKGLLQSAEALKTGIVTGVQSRLATSKTLERNPFTGWASVFNQWKHVGRLISAAHVATFQPAVELKQTLIARDVARNEGLRGQAFRQRVADILGNTDQRVNAARAQAASEGLTGLDLRRRTNEIIEQQREAAAPGIRDISQQYGRRASYLNPQYGAIGALVEGLDRSQRKIQDDTPVTGVASRTLVPFKHIVGNLINEKLNWFPTGAFRAALALRTGKLYGEEITDPQAVGDLFAKSALGTAALTAATVAMGQGLLAITGKGPRDGEKKKQLAAAGWKPNSIKIGNAYMSYLRTPLAVPFTVLGNYQDAAKYGDLDKTDGLNRAAFAAMAVPDAIVHQSFLKSIGQLLDAAAEPNPKASMQQMGRVMTQNAAGFAIPGVVMDIDRLFDPTRYDDSDIKSMLRSQVPFARRENKPVINALGEPLQAKLWDGDLRAMTPDPLWKALTQQDIFVPAPAKDTIVGDRKRGPDFYRTLTPDELYDYTVESGRMIRNRLSTRLPQILDADHDKAQKMVDEITRQERTKALKMFR